MSQAVKIWFIEKAAERKKKPISVKPWTLKRVVGELHKLEIASAAKTISGSDPGDHRFISVYQQALTKVVDSLDEGQIQEYTRLAAEYDQNEILKFVW